jgi:hypothetical protein
MYDRAQFWKLLIGIGFGLAGIGIVGMITYGINPETTGLNVIGWVGLFLGCIGLALVAGGDILRTRTPNEHPRQPSNGSKLGMWDQLLENMDTDGKAIREYDKWLCLDLQKHLSSLSMESRPMTPGSSECIHGSVFLGDDRQLLACLKVDGRNFDFLDVAKRIFENGTGNRVYIDYLFGYVVRGQPDQAIKNVHLKVFKKGLSQRKMTGFEWVGGDLAEKLNSDTELNGIIKGLEEGSKSLGVDNKLNEWGSTLQVHSNRKQDFVIFWQPVRGPNDFPSKEDIAIADRVCSHIQGMVQAST